MLLITFIFPKKSISQDNDAAWGAALAAGVGLVVAIEKNKEVLENLAANYVMENLPQYTEFSLQVIGVGGGGKKMSGEGTVSLVPFALTELSGGQKTENRNLILLFASRGWMNKFGVDYTKLRWEFWDQNKWNNLISKYGQLNSPIKSKISDNLFPEYLKFSSTKQAKPKDSGFISIKQGGENENYNNFKRDPNNSFISIKEMSITAEGLKNDYKIVYPFYDLKGDDYLVSQFDDAMKIFANENSLGIFLINTDDSILISRVLLNKVHDFINNKD